MTVDIDRVRLHVTIEIQRWVKRHGPDAKLKIVRSTVGSIMSPVIETAYLVEELTGKSDELTLYIDSTSKWYGVDKVVGKRS